MNRIRFLIRIRRGSFVKKITACERRTTGRWHNWTSTSRRVLVLALVLATTCTRETQRGRDIFNQPTESLKGHVGIINETHPRARHKFLLLVRDAALRETYSIVHIRAFMYEYVTYHIMCLTAVIDS